MWVARNGPGGTWRNGSQERELVNIRSFEAWSKGGITELVSVGYGFDSPLPASERALAAFIYGFREA
jgi:hypothetical protein